MELFFESFGILSAIAIVVIVLAIFRYYDKKRSTALKPVAKVLNFSFSSEEDAALPKQYQHFQLFSKGYSKRTRNVMRGKFKNAAIVIMDYRYTVGSGKSSHTYTQTVIAVKSDLDFPSFSLSPESLFHKIAGAFGYQDIDFHTHPDFSRQYLLRSPDEKAVRELFKYELLEFFEKREKISVEAITNEFIYYKRRKKLSPKEIPVILQDAIKLYELIKRM